MYKSLASLASLPAGTTILDVPCGGGIALRALTRQRSFRYIGCDISAQMIGRARNRAADYGFEMAEVIQADMRALPLEDESVDVCLCYNGLGMTGEPGNVVRELARCLRPGGTMLGSTLVSEGSRRQKLILSIQSRRGRAVPSGTVSELAEWLQRGGLTDVSIAPDHGFVVFSARRTSHP